MHKEWKRARAMGDSNAENIAHLKAENARKAMGYSGGADGSQRIDIGNDIASKYKNAYETAYAYAQNHNIDPRYIDDYANNNFDRSNSIVNSAVKNKASAWDIDSRGNYSGSTSSSKIFTPASTSSSSKYSANNTIANTSKPQQVAIQQRPMQQVSIQQRPIQPSYNMGGLPQLVSQNPEMLSLIERGMLSRFNNYMANNGQNGVDSDTFMQNLQRLIRDLQAQLQ